MKRIFISLMATALLATGCIYDFSADITGSDRRVVIASELMIGEECEVSLSYVMPFGETTERSVPAQPITAYLEGEDGSKYIGEASGVNSVLDLTYASSDTRYKLHVKDNDTSKEYETEWMDVSKAAVIDDLTYIPGDGVMNIGISLHANNQKYFRWRYEEIWEYHAQHRANFYYTPKSQLPKEQQSSHPYGAVTQFENEENIYYCWSKRQSTEILLFTTKEQTDDRFVDLEFHSIPQNSKKIQILYYIKVYVTTLDEDAYDYWTNMKSNSDYNGSLFAPNPSEMAGNISCVTSPTDQVLGYIYISEVATRELYIDNDKTDFYKADKSKYDDPELCESDDQWYTLYRQGKLPVDIESEEPVQYTWASKYCVDCRLEGGSKNKPSFWPNTHK